MEVYSLILAEDVPVPVARIGSPIATLLDRPAGEITRLFRQRPWILLEEVPADLLDPIFEILGREGVVAKAIPETYMPVLPHPLRVRIADPMEKGIFLQAAEPPAPPLLPWNGLTVVSAGLLELTEEEAASGTDVQPTGASPDLTTPGSAAMAAGRKTTRDYVLVDLVWTGENATRLRIDAGRFLYDCLGDRMKPLSRENMRTLLLDIGARIPSAVVTPRTARFLEGAPTSAYRFRTLQAFEDYTRWCLQAREEELLEQDST